MSYATFDAIKIGIASPEMIREWSYGEVKKPETINYRTLKPERDGLFCERIFGPTKDWECHCGKYKKIRYKGKICDRCGVEVTRAKVRRERMGHIELATPVSHIWYFKGIPSRMGLLLDISPRILEKVLYFAAYIVTDPGETPLMRNQILSEKEYRDMREKYEDDFDAGMGAEAVKKLLQQIDLEAFSEQLRAELKTPAARRRPVSSSAWRWWTPSASRQQARVDDHRRAAGHPAGDPPDGPAGRRPLRHLRPERPLPPRHQPQQPPQAPHPAQRAGHHRPQREAYAAGGGGRPDRQRPPRPRRHRREQPRAQVPVRHAQGQAGPLPSEPAGQARRLFRPFRYRGRPGAEDLSVRRAEGNGARAVPPFVMKKLVEDGAANNIKSAKKMVDKGRPEVWDALDVVIKDHPVMLNRAPTLHRLGIQAFEPVLVEGRALKLHPLNCTAFNADFDGDQMAIHVPLSAEAQAEARILMLSANNLLRPQDGGPVTVPTQDMVLGSYYLTFDRFENGVSQLDNDEFWPSRASTSPSPARAYERADRRGEGEHAPERLPRRGRGDARLQRPPHRHPPAHPGPRGEGTAGRHDGPQDRARPSAASSSTTTSRRIWALSSAWTRTAPTDHYFDYEITVTCGKKQLGKIVDRTIKKHGFTVAAEVLDNIKATGYKYSTIAAITISIADMTIPAEKYTLIAETEQRVVDIEDQFKMGFMTEDERYRAVVGVGKDHRRRYRRPAEEHGPLQPHLHDGGLRRPWFHEADPSADRYARPDGQHRR